jgi:hypothetical protein
LVTVGIAVVTVLVTVPTTGATAVAAVSTTVGGALGGTGTPPPGGGVLPVGLGVEPTGGVVTELLELGAVSRGVDEPCSCAAVAGVGAMSFGTVVVVPPMLSTGAAAPPAMRGTSAVRDPPGAIESAALPVGGSPATRTMLPGAPRTCSSFASRTAELEKGTILAAIRATLAGSGRERPRAAQNGTGNTNARTARVRVVPPCKEARAEGRSRCAVAAVMTKRALQALRANPRLALSRRLLQKGYCDLD